MGNELFLYCWELTLADGPCGVLNMYGLSLSGRLSHVERDST